MSKKIALLVTSLFFSIVMQAQDRQQPQSGPAPKININKPQTFNLANGLKVLVVENHKLPRVSFNLTIDNTPYAEGNKKGVSNLTSSLIGNGSKTVSKDKFNEEIDFLGANINFFSSGASASGLSKYSKRILELLADGALNPNFSQAELDKEKDKLIEGLKTQEKSVTAVAGRVENVLAYSKSHPAGEYLSEETIKNVTLEDVQNNYNSYFVPENAYLVVTGDVKVSDVKKAVEKLFGKWNKATAPKLTYTNPKNVQYSQINFVDMPNAVQSEISVINTVQLTMADADFFPVIIANQVLGGDFNSYLNMNLREAHGWTYGARSSVGFDKNQASLFKANSQVRNMVTDSAVVEFLKEIKKIRTEKVSNEMLNNVKQGYIGRFVMQVEKPATIARYALNIKTQGLPEDFYENYIKNINAVTAEDVQRVANKYFLADNFRIIIVGKGADVLPGLEKLKMPIFYFDKYGNPTEKPAMKKPVPAGVTTKTIIDKYIAASGGEKAIKSVKTIASTGTTSIPQAPAPLTYTSKSDIKGNMSAEFAMGGMSMMKQLANQKEGYMSQQGQKRAIEGADLQEMRESAIPFSETILATKPGVTTSGIEPINGSDAFAVVDGNTTHYFDVATGLKTAEARTTEQAGKKITSTTYYNDYKEVKGVKLPYNIIMNVGIELNIKISEIKINEGVTDKDFE